MPLPKHADGIIHGEDWDTLVDSVEWQPYSYIIYTEGGTYYAKNGATGAIDYSDADAGTLLTDVIAALPVDGGTIILIGNFTLANRVGALGLLIDKDYTRLIGVNAQIDFETNAITDGIKIEADYVEIAGINFTANTLVAGFINRGINGDALTETVGVKIHDCSFISKIYSGDPNPQNSADASIQKQIETGYANGWEIYNNYFYGAGLEGVSVGSSLTALSYGPISCIITDNRFNHNYGGLVLEGGASSCVVSGNTFLNTGVSFNILIRHGDSQYNTVFGNTCYNSTGRVIQIDEGARNNDIIGNTIHKTSNKGISVQGYDNLIQGNKIAETDMDGVQLSVGSGNTVQDNDITSGKTTAIVIQEGSNTIKGNVISFMSNYPIYIYDTASNTVVSGNIIRNTISSRAIYIKSNSSTFTRITGNIIYDDQEDDATTIDGAHLSGETAITVTDATDFTVGETIKTSPTGFGDELHKIAAINYCDNIITLAVGLTNDHTNGDTLVGDERTNSIGIDEEVGADYNIIIGNQIGSTYTTSIHIEGGNTIIKQNQGFVTENSGTATLLNGQTTIVVTHGLSYTPSAKDITITFTELPTNPTTGWMVGTFTATQFTLTANDPGASNLDFSWHANKTP